MLPYLREEQSSSWPAYRSHPNRKNRTAPDCCSRCHRTLRRSCREAPEHTRTGCTTRGSIRTTSTAIPRQIPNPSHRPAHKNPPRKRVRPNRSRIRGTRENRIRESRIRASPYAVKPSVAKSVVAAEGIEVSAMKCIGVRSETRVRKRPEVEWPERDPAKDELPKPDPPECEPPKPAPPRTVEAPLDGPKECQLPSSLPPLCADKPDDLKFPELCPPLNCEDRPPLPNECHCPSFIAE